MASIGDLVANLTVNTAPWKQGLNAANGSMASFAKGITKVVAPIAGALAAAWGAKEAVSGARTQIQAEKQLERALSSTTGVAGHTSASIKTLAKDLQNTAGISDEVTLGAAAMLAGFKKINGDEFSRTMKVAADMSAAIGGDLTSNVQNLGSILANPAEGMNALTSAGVVFTREQQNQIRIMQASGDMMGAQGVILKELETRYGGAAAELADPWAKASTVLKNVGDMFGMVLMPAIDLVSGAISVGGNYLLSFEDDFRSLGVEIAAWSAVAVEMFTAAATSLYDALSPAIDFIGTALSDLFEYIGGSSSFADWAIEAAVWVSHLGDVMKAIAVSMAANIITFGNDAAYVFTDTLPTYLTWFGDNFQNVMFTAVDYVLTIFINLGQNIRNMWSAVLEFIKGNGFEFDWTPLTEGAKSAIDKLPEIPQRAKSEFEKAIHSDADALNKNLSASMDKQRKELKKSFADAKSEATAKYTPKEPGKAGEGDGKQPLNAMSGAKAYGGAMAQGSTEAYSAIVQSMTKKNPQIDEGNRELKKIAKNTSEKTKQPKVVEKV